jgi:hypothetical protein
MLRHGRKSLVEHLRPASLTFPLGEMPIVAQTVSCPSSSKPSEGQ